MKTAVIKASLLTVTFLTGGMCVTALAAGVPKIQFEQTVFDFGKTSVVETVSGTFKFKNIGDGLLKLEAPKTSCGCTVATLKSDTLQPGENGEMSFTLNLGRQRTSMEKHITVKSNDPRTPEARLDVRVDYTPLYEMTPMMLAPNLPLGLKMTNEIATLIRTDGKPLGRLRLVSSKPWIIATVEPGAKAASDTARLRIGIQREGNPRRFSEYVHVYLTDQTNIPISTINLYGQVMGEVSVNPETLYWSVTPGVPAAAQRPEALALRRLTIRSANGQAFELKNPRCSIQGIHLELVPMESGKAYELVAQLNEAPGQTVSGNVSFETSLAAQPRIEVPVIVNVFKQ